MQLSKWMKENRKRDIGMALLCGVDRATIYRIRKGHYKPTWPLMRKIAEVTNNKVKPNDFLDEGGGAGG